MAQFGKERGIISRNISVMGILVDERARHGPEVQEVLTRYGSRILMRSGIPDPGRERGIITLIAQADGEELGSLEKDLEKINGVTVKSVTLAEALG